MEPSTLTKMDIKATINNKKLIIIIAVIMVMVLAILVTFIIINNNKNITQANKTKIKFIGKSFDYSFLNPFATSPKTTLKLTKTIVVVTTTLKPIKIIKIIKKSDTTTTISNLFYLDKKTSQIKIDSVNINKHLQQANNSTEIKTYYKFNKNTNNQDLSNIDTHYKDDIQRVDATYPVDFSRVLTVDRQIPAILINDINSSLSGRVLAQVESNVYAAHGNLILIPVGSKLVGEYRSLDKIGDNRLKIEWQRIITPKGINITIGIDTVDSMGRSGIGGEVDNRYIDRYGLSLLISTVNAAALYNIETTADKVIFINSFGKELTDLTSKILEQNINIKPVIKIPHGTRILVTAVRDIHFRNTAGNIVIQAFNFKEVKNEQIN